MISTVMEPLWFVLLLLIVVDVLKMSRNSANGGLISQHSRDRILKQDTDKPLSASEIRSIFTTGKCCIDKNCMGTIRMPKDPSCCPTCAFSSTEFCGECPTPGNKEEGEKHGVKVTDYERLIGFIRKPSNQFRSTDVDSKESITERSKAMTTYLMTHFSERFTENDSGKRFYKYELLCPLVSTDYIPICKTAWHALFGIGAEKLDYAQRCLKQGETHEARTMNAAGAKQPMQLKDAYEYFGLDYDDSWKYHKAYLDLEAVGNTSRMVVAAVWIADEVVSIGDNEVRFSTPNPTYFYRLSYYTTCAHHQHLALLAIAQRKCHFHRSHRRSRPVEGLLRR